MKSEPILEKSTKTIGFVSSPKHVTKPNSGYLNVGKALKYPIKSFMNHRLKSQCAKKRINRLRPDPVYETTDNY
jgi:hypothetical protein